MTDTQPTDPAVRDLGRRLAALERQVRDQGSADQADARAVTDGSIDVYDDDGNLRGRAGKQPDGGFSFKAFGVKPETPTEPDVIPVPGGCIVEWDGTFEDAQTDDVQRVAIHVGTTPDFEVNDDEDEDSDEEATEKAAILSPRGGSAFLALDPGQETYYVRLTAVAEGGAESDPTDAVEVIIAAPEAAFYQDDFTLDDSGGQVLYLTFTPLDYSEHVYWNSLYQREDVTWTRIDRKITLTGSPYPAKVGDRVVVEYAYNPGEEPNKVPLDGHAYRLTEGQIPYLYGRPVWERNAPFTMEAIVKLRSLPSADRVLTAQSGSPSWKDSFRLYVTPDGRVKVQVVTSAAATEFFDNGLVEVSGGSLADLNGHHVAFVWRAPIARLYVDGKKVVELTTGANVMHSYHHEDVLWGNRYISNEAPPADIDELAMYDRALSESEIKDHVRGWTVGQYPSRVVESAPKSYCRLDGLPGSGGVANISPGTIGAGLSWYQPAGQPQAVLADPIQRGE